MFKIPDWGDDVPKTQENFTKNQKKKNKTTPTTNTSDKEKPIPINKRNALIKKPKDNNNKLSVNGRIRQRKTLENKAKPNFDKNIATKKTTIPENFNKTVKNPVYINENNETKNFTPNNKRKNRKRKKNDNQTQVDDVKINEEENDSYNFLGFIEKPNRGRPKKKLETEELRDDGEINLNLEDLDLEKADEVLLKVKKKKLNAQIKREDQESLLFADNKKNHKKEKFRKLLEAHRTPIKVEKKSSNLRTRMLEKLKAAQFRYLNEKLYTSSGTEAQQLFTSDPTAFQTYHEGYQLQVQKWPVNPLDVIVKKIMKMPKTHLIADMGCGEASLSKRVPHTVRSFDLVATAPGVETCNIAHTPLLTSSVDVAVYCLALMGTDLTQYLVEANRVLKDKGHLFIAEVESRFDNVEAFTKDVEKLGFKLKNLDKSHEVFFFMEFVKNREAPVKKAKLPTLTLKPCLYKRR